MIGELRNRIIITPYTNSVDDGGGVTAVAGSPLEVWAKVENRTGGVTTTNQQIWNYDYKITIRFRSLNDSDLITYGGKEMRINNSSVINEGRKVYLILRCELVGNKNVNNGSNS